MAEAPDNKEVLRAIRDAKVVVISAIVLAAVVIVGTMLFLRSQEPYWKCRTLAKDGVRGVEIAPWEDLGCGSPPLLPPDET